MKANNSDGFTVDQVAEISEKLNRNILSDLRQLAPQMAQQTIASIKRDFGVDLLEHPNAVQLLTEFHISHFEASLKKVNAAMIL